MLTLTFSTRDKVGELIQALQDAAGTSATTRKRPRAHIDDAHDDTPQQVKVCIDKSVIVGVSLDMATDDDTMEGGAASDPGSQATDHTDELPCDPAAEGGASSPTESFMELLSSTLVMAAASQAPSLRDSACRVVASLMAWS